jgi:pimeloyl-ACP methyl ester carboxylesterase
MPFVSIVDCNLYYEMAGTGAPVVYVHGGFASLETVLRDLTSFDWTWERDFAAQFTFVAYDRRGCYRSSSPSTGYDLFTQVSDLLALLDQLSIPSAHIIGSSAGGPISILFAATHAHRTRSLTLVGTACHLFPVGEPGSDIVRQQLAILDREGAEAAFDQRPPEVEVTFSELWDQAEAMARGNLEDYLQRQQQWRAQAQRLPRAQRVHYYITELRNMAAYMQVDVCAYATSVRVPTYVIQGSNDQLVPVQDAQALAQTIPDAQFDLIVGGPHSLMIRHAEARQRVMTFMHAVDGRGAEAPN